jgi:threonine dehydrogenase-like Zn-dependent dehydrogenase
VKAVVMLSLGELAVVDDWQEPGCRPGDVVVAVRGVGLCGSDAAVASGERPVPRLPWLVGHEAFGVIVAVGAAVTDRHVGQRVVIEPNFPCLACDRCQTGGTAGCATRRIPGISEPGLLAERVAVPAQFSWPVPDEWPDEDLVCIEPLTVAMSAVRRSGIRRGERCLVVGAGSQGLLTCLALRHEGAVPVVTDPHKGRVRLAEQLGACSASAIDPGEQFPVVIETSGAPKGFEAALERVAPGGCLAVVGQSTQPARISTLKLVQRRLTIQGCLIYDHPDGFARTIAALGGASLRPGRVLQARFDLDEAPKAYAEIGGIAGKSWIVLPPR